METFIKYCMHYVCIDKMITKEIVLKALIKNQDQLTELEAVYLLGYMKDREYLARKKSLKLAFRKYEKDAKRLI